MEEQYPHSVPDEQAKRPVFLTVICILTFIGSGMNLLSSLLTAVAFDAIMPIMIELAQKMKLPGVEALEMTTPGFLTGNALLYGISVAGAILMMRLRKIGFHFYTIAQILLVIFPMYFYKLSSPGLPELFFSGLFIFFYSMNLKFMR
jgi:hypothetical protein